MTRHVAGRDVRKKQGGLNDHACAEDGIGGGGEDVEDNERRKKEAEEMKLEKEGPKRSKTAT